MSGLVASPEKRITPSLSARGAAPSMAPLHEVPRMIFTPSTSVSLRYAVMESCALHFSSSTISFSILPFMPPAAFISSAAICLACTATVPYVSPGPVTDSMTPTTNGPAGVGSGVGVLGTAAAVVGVASGAGAVVGTTTAAGADVGVEVVSASSVAHPTISASAASVANTAANLNTLGNIAIIQPPLPRERQTRPCELAIITKCSARAVTGAALAPQVGFEPTANRLTADCSTTELLRSA